MDNLENTQQLPVLTEEKPHPRELNEREKLIGKLRYSRAIVIADMWEVARLMAAMPEHLILQNRWAILKNDLNRISYMLKAVIESTDYSTSMYRKIKAAA